MRKTTTMLAALAVAMTTAAAGAGAQRPMAQRQLFRGITLTDTQHAQIQKLRDANRTQMQAMMQSARTDRQALRTAYENGDTVALKAARQHLDGWRNRTIALRGQMQRDVRGVLTPDQQKVFDANRTRLEQRMARGARAMRQERMWGRRQALMRFMAPNRMGFMRGRGFRPGMGFQRGGGSGGGPAFQRGRGMGPGAGFQRGGGLAPG
ncbi:MAG: Spy/CpxP family protein refolding chaperone, partial [Gemmatimonadota bacterium]|nr:Spy/CpxP family protein refolding chaperone [Gemmatimonadota bacterium]